MKGSNRYLCCMALIIRATWGGGGEAFYTRETRTRGPAGKKFMFRDKLVGGGGQTGEIKQLEERKIFVLSRFHSRRHGRDGEWEMREG